MKNLRYLLIAVTLFLSSCEHDFLETENLNQPDLESVLANPNDWEDVIMNQYRLMWHTFQEDYASTVFAGMADILTSSWGFMQEENAEPRNGLRNDRGYRVIERPYYQSFEVISSANDILRLLKEKPDAKVLDEQAKDIREKLTSTSYLLRGLAYGNLAIKYDKAQFISEDTPILEAPNQPFLSYVQLLEKALNDLETAASIAKEAPPFAMNYFNGVSFSKETYIQFIRTLQAKFSIHISRDAAENEANDWGRILVYAQQGLDFDLVIVGNDDWFDNCKWRISLRPNPHARVDYRVIAAMAKDTPSRFPQDIDPPILSEPETIDQRLLTDMEYAEFINFPPDRGLYYYSHYLYSRYQYYESGLGDIPWILKAENDLMIAEALIRTGGSKITAAELINITRVGRGSLTALTGAETDQEMYDAIMHERFIELLGTNGGQPFFDRRRLPEDDGSFDPYLGLQPGTPRQLPVPVQELDLLGMEVYTFP